MKDTPRITIYLKLRAAWDKFGNEPQANSLELMGEATNAIAEAARMTNHGSDPDLVDDVCAFVVCLYEDSVTYFIEHLNDCLLGKLRL